MTVTSSSGALSTATKDDPTLSSADSNGGHAAASPRPQPPVTVPRAVAPHPAAVDADLGDPTLYFNKELGWLDFNWRVLALAMDPRTPLLERVKFVAITANNLDEFVQKRVGGLKRQEAAHVSELSIDGRTPRQQLQMLRAAIAVMHTRMTALWEDELKPALAEQAQIVVKSYDELDIDQRRIVATYFQDRSYSVLTPLAVDPGHPFPFISNLSLSLAVILRNPKDGAHRFARLKLPGRRWIDVTPADRPDQTVLIAQEDVIRAHIGELFAGMDVAGVYPFRITRNADVQRDEEEAEDLIEMIAAELRERRFAPVVRLEIAQNAPDHVCDLLMNELDLNPEDIYRVDGLVDLTGLFQLASLHRPEFQDAPWEPVIPQRLRHDAGLKGGMSIFDVIRQGDVLVHHPYESFTASTARLIREAAVDPNVLAIKQTLYRTSDDSPIIAALIAAAEKGKQVAALVEVTARFDEANNIEWAGVLENAGVHVAYGVVGLKTHTKATLVVRREPDGIRNYCHIGTGNYNAKTARLYTDFGLLTCRPELGHDLAKLFHFLTGFAPTQSYTKVLVAPNHMRNRFEELIEREIEHQRAHGSGRIIAKMNALDDTRMIRRLYAASQAGVSIDLIIRGHCALRPGLPGYSENIRVISILGRFLEHDRIYYFHNNGVPDVLIGSADWRARNLNRRVELITPVDEPAFQRRLIDILNTALTDNRFAWDLDAEGQYRLRMPGLHEEERSFQQILMRKALAVSQPRRRLGSSSDW